MLSAALTAFFEAVGNFFGFRAVDIENKPTSELVKDRRSLKKATNYTEQLIEIVDKYTEYFTKRDFNKYNTLKRKFNKNN